MVGGLHKITGNIKVRISFSIKQFQSCMGRNLPFLTELAIGLYKIVTSQQIKEVIANGHEKLNKLITAQTP